MNFNKAEWWSRSRFSYKPLQCHLSASIGTSSPGWCSHFLECPAKEQTVNQHWESSEMHRWCVYICVYTNTYESIKCNVKYLQAFKIFTCKLPLGQYSVTMQMFGGSIQAPINLVRWLNCTSLIYKKTTKWTFSVVSLLAMKENQDLLCNVNWAFESWTLLLKKNP